MSDKRCEDCAYFRPNPPLGSIGECYFHKIAYKPGKLKWLVTLVSLSCDYFTPKEPAVPKGPFQQFVIDTQVPPDEVWLVDHEGNRLATIKNLLIPKPKHTEEEWFALYGRFADKWSNKHLDRLYGATMWCNAHTLGIDNKWRKGIRTEELWNDMTKAVQG